MLRVLLSCHELGNINSLSGAFSLLRPSVLGYKTSVGFVGGQVAKTQTGGEWLAPPSGPAGLEQAWGGLARAP